MPNGIDLESALGNEDYEFIQEYIEEHSRRMNEKKFCDRYRTKSMWERLHDERTADVFEIEERKEWESDEEEWEDNPDNYK